VVINFDETNMLLDYLLAVLAAVQAFNRKQMGSYSGS
jgi:hypothetical protein